MSKSQQQEKNNTRLKLLGVGLGCWIWASHQRAWSAAGQRPGALEARSTRARQGQGARAGRAKLLCSKQSEQRPATVDLAKGGAPAWGSGSRRESWRHERHRSGRWRSSRSRSLPNRSGGGSMAAINCRKYRVQTETGEGKERDSRGDGRDAMG